MKRYQEGYDLETDELYVIWSKFKVLNISSEADSSISSSKTSVPPTLPILPIQHQSVFPVLDDILTHPDPPRSKNVGKIDIYNA